MVGGNSVWNRGGFGSGGSAAQGCNVSNVSAIVYEEDEDRWKIDVQISEASEDHSI
jgi:hypothetical protein